MIMWIKSPFFSIISAIYIAGIFLIPNPDVVSMVSPFNPLSLLHIPLYGILTILLSLSFIPLKYDGEALMIKPLFLSGLISLLVGMADEIYQAQLPYRNASITDLLLDLVGILFAIIIRIFLLLKIKRKRSNFLKT